MLVHVTVSKISVYIAFKIVVKSPGLFILYTFQWLKQNTGDHAHSERFG